MNKKLEKKFNELWLRYFPKHPSGDYIRVKSFIDKHFIARDE